MIADSVAFLVGAGQARAVRRRALLRRLRARPRLRAATACAPRPTRAPSGVVLCDTNGGSLPPQVARRRSRSCAKRCRDVALGIHTPRRLRLRASPTRSPAVEAGATQVQGTINGIGERTGNANLDHDHRRPAAEDGRRAARARAPGAPDRDRALRRRAAQPHARTRPSPTSASTPSRTRPACTPPACAPTRRPSSTSTPTLVGNARDVLVSELSGKRHDRREGAPRPGIDARTSDARPARRRARQGARARGLPVRGRRRLASSC